MSTASEKSIQAIERVVKGVGVGTNLGLVHLLWVLMRGSFVSSRGAIFSALSMSGFSKQEIYRSWQALRKGTWSIGKLVENWRAHVEAEGAWQAQAYEGYRPLSVDTTTFWRLRLKGWVGKFYRQLANRAMTGVSFGLLVQIGEVDGERVPLIKAIIPAGAQEASEKSFKQNVLWHVSRHLADDEVAVHDAGASIVDMQEAGIERFVLRQAKNCTARRNEIPAYQRGRPTQFGAIVRPLARCYREQTTPATAPDEVTQFYQQQRTIKVHGWHGLVRRDQKASPTHQTFSIWVFFDPLYKTPLVLATNMTLLPASIFQFYLDRWPVEQVPLVAKQLLGLQRHFVSAPLSCIRLPALALLAANILTHLAATLPAMPTGFWDRYPKKLLAVYDALWLALIFPLITLLTRKFEKRTRRLATYPLVLSHNCKLNHLLSSIFGSLTTFTAYSRPAGYLLLPLATIPFASF